MNQNCLSYRHQRIIIAFQKNVSNQQYTQI